MKTFMEKQQSSVIDVALFFNDISKGYLHLEDCSLKLIENISSLSPTQIKKECDNIIDKKSKLNQLDDQLLEIIILAGKELSNEQMLNDYRIAFAKAVMACDNLHQKLTSIRSTLHNTTLLFDVQLGDESSSYKE